MADNHADEIGKHVKTYLIVFGALMVLTLATVGVYYIHMHPVAAIAVALFIASVKGSLVAGFFMHLISEKKMIYWILALTVVFFIFLLFLPFLTSMWDQVGG